MFGLILFLLGALLLIGAFARVKDAPTLTWKERVGGAVAGLLLVVVGFSMLSSPAQPSQNKQPTQPLQAAQPAQPEPQEEAAQESAAQQDEPTPPVIPGLHWADITLNLEKEPFGFRFTLERNEFTPTFERRAKRVDPDTGAEMLVRVVSYGDSVVLYEATVSGPGANLTAGWFIPYLATAPFEGNPQVESKQWTEGALKKVRQGQPVERRVGEVVMGLSGNPPFFYALKVSHKDYEAYLAKVLR